MLFMTVMENNKGDYSVKEPQQIILVNKAYN